MKRICILLLFLPGSVTRLSAQQDYSEEAGKDSIDMPEVTLKLDSTYYPPCIIPWEYEEIVKTPILAYNFFRLNSGCHAKGAKKDLQRGKAIIWFPGGITGCDFSSKADQEFQKKYGVQFISPGCSRIGDEGPEAYNKVIFQYLDKKYGTGWRDELRTDAKGFVPPTTADVTAKTEQLSPLSLQLAHQGKILASIVSPETDTSVWWYVLPTSGFALLLSLYFIIKRKRKD
jgi:hypothetical protein